MWGFVQNQVMWNFVNMCSKFSAVPSFSRRGGSLSAPGGSSGCGLAFLPPVFGGNHRVHHVANVNGDHRLRIPSKPWQYGRLVRLGLIGRGWRLILQYPRPVQAVWHRHQPRREAFGAGGIQPRAGYVQTIETLEVGSQFDRVDADLRFEASDFPSWSV